MGFEMCPSKVQRWIQELLNLSASPVEWDEGTDWTSYGCGGIYTARTELLAHCVSASRLDCQRLGQPFASVTFKSPQCLIPTEWGRD